MEKAEVTNSIAHTYRKILSLVVTQLLQEKGFDSVDEACLETFTEMLQSLIVECGSSARAYSELSGRTVPVVSDVAIALINMGISLKGLDKFAKREGRHIIPLPPVASQQKPLSLLQAGTKASHPPHIPNHLPTLPDPHAYVRTPTHKQPVTEYEAIREKAATQKRDIERALTKFLSKTSETQSLFDTEDTIFPLIACKPSFPPYLSALNPTDQVFDFEELEYHYLVANRTEDVPTKDDENDENDSANEDGSADGISPEENGGCSTSETKTERKERQQQQHNEVKSETKAESDIKPNSGTNKAILENPNIDNPYLRAATLPKKIKPDLGGLLM